MKAADFREQFQRQQRDSSAQLPRGQITEVPSIEEDLALLSDSDKGEPLRIAALSRLRAASFNVVDFAKYRASFFEVLRDIVRSESSPKTLWKEALSVLSLESDSFAQAFIKECLDDPDCTLIGVADALRLLSVDDHSNVVAIAKRHLDQTNPLDVRVEALRALAADPDSEGLISQMFNDRSENVNLRQIAGSALRSLNPVAYQSDATRIIADSEEDPLLRTSGMVNLSNMEEAFDDQAITILKQSLQTSSRDLNPAFSRAAARLTERLQETSDTEPVTRSRSNTEGAPSIFVTKNFDE